MLGFDDGDGEDDPTRDLALRKQRAPCRRTEARWRKAAKLERSKKATWPVERI